ncbi:hypothetical protein [Adhaeribacter rhizoryzae]|uniref:Uncharacterized protein n=1 Tax=Adhaeribacter rhizoryzae TaxID=2607907 RepID=A0A5M6DJG5_9BACT|nr:hypothetical protein [Adhaeribacter rhizoryzae]KAA5547707.1 hypothetical protein F0145_07085 [Adhaeribacter rhizoryzae]
MVHWLTRLTIILCACFLWSCARHHYFQEDALYKPAEKEKLAPPKPGYVWATAGRHYNRSGLHQLIWGKHYRTVWAIPVEVPILNPAELAGGLMPVEKGGGLQTTSLTLVNPNGRTFTLRTLDKDPAKSLSSFWQKTFLQNLMRDQTSAINPYAAFTIPPLAQAANIFHTNPNLYYVAATKTGLGQYQQNFSGKLTMLEEKFVNEKSLPPAFKQAKNILNSEKLFEQLKKSPHQQVDQLAFARARLFDILIEDLDRHEGQWNWAEYPTAAGGSLYKPIPKDRDYAYYQFADGLIPWLLTRRILVGHIKPFIHNIPDVGGLTHKSQKLDKQLLNQLTAEDWQKVAKELQAALTPAVIQQAVSRFPNSVYALTGEKTRKELETRVQKLPELAQEYYKLLTQEIKILGTEQQEKFVVQQQAAKTTLVEVFTIPTNAGEQPRLLYKRAFTFPETKKITLDGLGNNDQFVINKPNKKKPEIKVKARKNKHEIIATHD